MPVVCLYHEACSFLNKWNLLKSTTTGKKAERFCHSMSSSFFFFPVWKFFLPRDCVLSGALQGTSNGLFTHFKQTQCLGEWVNPVNGCHVMNISRLMLTRYLCVFHRVFSLSAHFFFGFPFWRRKEICILEF